MITPFIPPQDPFGKDRAVTGSPFSFYQWPASWVWPEASNPDEPVVFGARLDFSLNRDETLKIHVSADQRFELFLDGQRFARGPELSDVAHWMYASFELELAAGAHRLAARVWFAADQAGYAQQTVRGAFLCAGEGDGGERFHTGKAPWRLKRLGGYRLIRRKQIWLAPPRQDVDLSQVEPDWLEQERGWEAPHVGPTARTEFGTDTTPLWVLHPALLPPQRETPVEWAAVRHAGLIPEGSSPIAPPALRGSNDLVALGSSPIAPPALPGSNALMASGTSPAFLSATDDPQLLAAAAAWISGKAPLTLPPGKSCRLLLDTGIYRCAWPRLVARGGAGARLSLLWAESLYTMDPAAPKALGSYGQADKGHRAETEGKFFRGEGDTWLMDGREQVLESHVWHAGRFVLLSVQGGTEPLILSAPTLVATGYPMDLESRFASSDARLDASIPILWNVLRACSHETYMDCPYYERMMYVGDTRLEALVTYVATSDSRLPRKALTVFDWSRTSVGLTASRYPTRFRQTIPPFSLWWVAMVKDYAWWRDEAETARRFLPGTRAVLDFFLSNLDEEGLPLLPRGWNFHDWVPGWPAGMMPDGRERGILAWHLLYTLGLAIDLETALGETEFAERYRRHQKKLFALLDGKYWVAGRGLWSDDDGHAHFSEHVNSLAILSGLVDSGRVGQVAESLLTSMDLARATVYYSHYLFEALARAARVDALVARLDLWRNLAGQGFTTTPEMPEPTRSDCHAWGAHPLYHFFASILGIRPADAGFRTILIEPQFGGLDHAEGTMVHPLGEIHVKAQIMAGQMTGMAKIPAGAKGILRVGGKVRLFEGEVTFG